MNNFLAYVESTQIYIWKQVVNGELEFAFHSQAAMTKIFINRTAVVHKDEWNKKEKVIVFHFIYLLQKAIYFHSKACKYI